MDKKNKKKDYNKVLRSKEWQRKRAEILERDENKCTCCGTMEGTLHVHHDRYYRGLNVWDVENKYLRTLCPPCHEDVHKRKNISLFFFDAPAHLAKLAGLPVKVNKTKKRVNKSNAEKSREKLYKGMSRADKTLQDRYNKMRAEGKLI